ncbi:hypothetical protein OG417_23510 [Actinoallomurus sp. NBC_01490]|uniref:hypothetical protein n=1 Tax=Actinoallomurus sp. NBC_01490 TaxID=2903557 RepID=UPI002E35FFD5|nr:hypothetical protein [Actinoallomurus sp. NBC_01490]
MSTVAVVVIVIVVLVVLAVAGYFARAQARRRGLRQRFGPEYDRAVKDHRSTREAEQELLARQKRHDRLEIRPLAPEVRDRHLAEWRQVQERFVDAPETAVTEADRLIHQVMSERGYPTDGGYEQQVADLSVEHAATIDRYRQAHDISARAGTEQASTEDLRQAMVHYRALFTELLDIGDEAGAADRAAEPDAAGARASTGTPAAEPSDAPSETEEQDAEAERAETAPPARSGARTKTGARAQAAAERAETETKARAGTTAGRRTARRDGDDEGA